MKNKAMVITAVFLMISIGSYFRIVTNEHVRTVEFLTIFAIGALSGVLLTQIVQSVRNKNQHLPK